MPEFASQAKRVRHVKRGLTYHVLTTLVSEKDLKEGDKLAIKTNVIMKRGTAPLYVEMQCSLRDVRVGDLIVVYRCEQTSKLWGRLLDDFNTPGRFEIIG